MGGVLTTHHSLESKATILNAPDGTFLCFVLYLCYHQKLYSKRRKVCYNPNLVKDTSKKSIKSIAVAVMNGRSIKINYHLPGVRKRVIWGGSLVPYDKVWVTEAHDATTLETNKNPHTERLQYFIENTMGNMGIIRVAWEK